MTSLTPNIGLTVFNATGDVGVPLLNFRNLLAQDTSSNMTIIDTEIQALIDSVAGLSSGTLFRVAATEFSSNVYINGAVSGFPIAYANNIFIALSLATAVTGAATLNINSIGAKYLMKYNTAGTLVNLASNDLMINKINLFVYSTAGSGQWIWINATAADQLNVPSGVSGNFLKTNTDGTIADSGSSPSTFAVAAKGVTNGDTHDHIGGDGNPIVEGALSFSDIATANASTTAHGLVVKATAPAANVLNVVGLTNGETAYTNKSIFDSTNPAAIGTVSAGTSLIAAHRDHVHAADHANLTSIGTNTHAQIDTQFSTTIPATYAVIANGVTGGETHTHASPYTSGGGQIDYNSLSNLPVAGSLLNVQVYTSGTGTFTPNADTTKMYVICLGAGGGGGGYPTSAGASGSGGGCGGISYRFYSTVSGTYAYSIGTGGAGVSGAGGATGGSTTFDVITSSGGVGGGVGVATPPKCVAGGLGGTASGGDLNISGNNGHGSTAISSTVLLTGRGGDTTFGRGGNSRTTTGIGSAGVGYGSGGAGGGTTTGATANSGGAGADGLIIIYEYK